MNTRLSRPILVSTRFAATLKRPSSTYKPLRNPTAFFHLTRFNRTLFQTSRSRSPPQARALYSGFSVSAIVGGAIISVAGFYLWNTTLNQSLDSSAPPEASLAEKTLDVSSEIPWIRVYPRMPPQIPPGRPGNLTKDQEMRLKELWEALMSICGVTSGESQPASATASMRSPSPDQGGKKKHRFGGLLGRKKHDDSDASGTESGAEDKYGLNKEFKQALASQSPQELRDTFWFFSKADDPDAVLLRFLRARKWNVHDALVMLVSTIRWRGQVMHLDDDVMKNGEAGALEDSTKGQGQAKQLGEDFLKQMRMGKSFLHGTDREGRPLCFVRAKLHRAGEQSDASLERATVFTIETARFMLRPPVDTACIVFDLTDFSMANMDYAPVKFMIKVFEANYPESLGHVLVHRSPWIFQGVWSIIKGWLDPVVASKVHFTKNTHELEEFIDPLHIPKGMGGQEDWEYRYVEPRADENAAMRDAAKRAEVEAERARLMREYEVATVEWTKGKGAGDAVQGKRVRLAEALRHNYWKLDPYVRARSVYDRTGVIRPGGGLHMYPGEGSSSSNGRAIAGAVDGAAEGPVRPSVDAGSVYYDAKPDYHEGDVD